VTDPVLTSGAPDAFELAAGRFAAAAAAALPPELAFLAFASPISARTPDESDIWHPGLRARSAPELLAAIRATIGRERLKGVARLARDRSRYAFALYGQPGANLLVLTSICGTPVASADTPGFTTPYVPTAPDDALLVFGDRSTCGPAQESLPATSAIAARRVTAALLVAGREGGLACGIAGVERELLEATWEAWALGGRWAREWRLADALDIASQRTPDLERIGCIHEMHAYARVVWHHAARQGLARHTVQHAVVASGKRWYFSTADERAAGLVLPDVMYAFCDRDIELLSSAMPDTTLMRGCSGRYAGWRGSAALAPQAAGCVLFAGALAGFDNDALFAAARAYTDSGAAHGIPRIRLHPYAVVSPRDREWLDAATSQGLVELSADTPLAHDLAAARVVVGMGTTVLQEALLLGRPVVQLADPAYVTYVDMTGFDAVLRVDADSFSATDVAAALALEPDHDQVRDRLGLDKPLVDYARLFAKVGTVDVEEVP